MVEIMKSRHKKYLYVFGVVMFLMSLNFVEKYNLKSKLSARSEMNSANLEPPEIGVKAVNPESPNAQDNEEENIFIRKHLPDLLY